MSIIHPILGFRRLRLRNGVPCSVTGAQSPGGVRAGRMSLSLPGRVFWVGGTARVKAQRLETAWLLDSWPGLQRRAKEQAQRESGLRYGGPFMRERLPRARRCPWPPNASVQEEGGGGAGKNDPSPQGQVTLECARSCDHNETSKSGRYLRAVETLRQASSRGGA